MAVHPILARYTAAEACLQKAFADPVPLPGKYEGETVGVFSKVYVEGQVLTGWTQRRDFLERDAYLQSLSKIEDVRVQTTASWVGRLLSTARAALHANRTAHNLRKHLPSAEERALHSLRVSTTSARLLLQLVSVDELGHILQAADLRSLVSLRASSKALWARAQQITGWEMWIAARLTEPIDSCLSHQTLTKRARFFVLEARLPRVLGRVITDALYDVLKNASSTARSRTASQFIMHVVKATCRLRENGTMDRLHAIARTLGEARTRFESRAAELQRSVLALGSTAGKTSEEQWLLDSDSAGELLGMLRADRAAVHDLSQLAEAEARVANASLPRGCPQIDVFGFADRAL